MRFINDFFEEYIRDNKGVDFDFEITQDMGKYIINASSEDGWGVFEYDSEEDAVYDIELANKFLSNN